MSPNRGDIWYEKAKYECRIGRLEAAIISLTVASSFEGYYVTLAQYQDPDFKPLRTDPKFLSLVKWRNDELPELDEELFRLVAGGGP